MTRAVTHLCALIAALWALLCPNSGFRLLALQETRMAKSQAEDVISLPTFVLTIPHGLCSRRHPAHARLPFLFLFHANLSV